MPCSRRATRLSPASPGATQASPATVKPAVVPPAATETRVGAALASDLARQTKAAERARSIDLQSAMIEAAEKRIDDKLARIGDAPRASQRALDRPVRRIVARSAPSGSGSGVSRRPHGGPRQDVPGDAPEGRRPDLRAARSRRPGRCRKRDARARDGGDHGRNGPQGGVDAHHGARWLRAATRRRPIRFDAPCVGASLDFARDESLRI